MREELGAFFGRAQQGETLLLSTTEEESAGETDQGGLFTLELASALKRRDRINLRVGAVTAYTAFTWAENNAATKGQHPLHAGATAALDLPLGWPPGEETKAPVSTGPAPAGGALGSVTAEVVTRRQISLEGSDFKGSGADRELVIHVTFLHDTDSLRVGLYSPPKDPKATPQPELFTRGGGARRKTQDVTVPLRGLGTGMYRVVVQPCAAGGTCGGDGPREFEIELK